MDKLTLPVHLKDVTDNMLQTLGNKRVRDVLESRFGFKDGRRRTLESIGQKYNITRERVRQIEENGLSQLVKFGAQDMARPVVTAVADHLARNGEISEERRLFDAVADRKYHPHLHFVLALVGRLTKQPETETHHDRWYTKEDVRKAAEKILERVVAALEQIKKPVSENELYRLLSEEARAVLSATPEKSHLDSYLSISKVIGKNPFQEYGLTHWATIHPKGVRDKAYVVLAKAGRPIHFSEITSEINKVGWSKKKAHVQTVHNELIKSPNFVLVGRGLYALKEWGYDKGTVKDVLMSVLREAKHPLSQAEVVKQTLGKRFVKENTIMLNLQDRTKFKKVDEGYALV